MAALFPFPYAAAFPTWTDREQGEAWRQFYNDPDLDGVQLNVMLGGYALSWTTVVPGLPQYNQVFYMVGHPATPDPDHRVDGGYLVDVVGDDWLDDGLYFNSWNASGSFEVGNNPWYVIPDMTFRAPVVQAGYRRYPGIAATNAWDQYSYIQCLNLSQPVLFEMWYSENTTKTNPSVGFHGYTFFGDMAGNFPYCYRPDGATQKFTRKYVAGVFRVAVDLANIQIADVVCGVIYDGNSTGGIGKIILNGVVQQTLNASFGASDALVYAGWETAYGLGLVDNLQGLTGYLDYIELAVGGQYIGLYGDSNPPTFLFDTYNTKFGWYVDYETGLAPGTIDPDQPNFYSNPPMMYTHPGWPVPQVAQSFVGKGEQRVALRLRPRRTLTLKLTLGTDADALGFVQWLAANQGHPVWMPQPQHGRRVTVRDERLATTLAIDHADAAFLAALQPEFPGSTQFGSGGLLVNQGEALILDGQNGWQRVTVQGNTATTLLLAEPLARPVSAMAKIYPAMLGVIRQSTRAAHLADKIVDVTLDMDTAPPAYSHVTDGGWTADILYQGMPVLHDAAGHHWIEPHEIGFDAGLEILDVGIAPVWSQRISDRSPVTMSRRLYAHGAEAIFKLRGLLDYCRGRLKPLWLDEQIHGIELAAPVAAGTDRLVVKRGNLPAWAREASVLWVRQHGQAAYALRSHSVASHDADTAYLYLAEPAPVPLGVNTRITRLLPVRLNHDAVDLIWHTDLLLEVNLSFVVIPFSPAGAYLPQEF